jgi:hypothetical protein
MATSLDEANTEMLRRVLDDVLTDPEFNTQASVSAFQVAEHIWRQAAIGVPDFDRIKYSALSLLNSGSRSSHTQSRPKANIVDQNEIRSQRS